MTTLGIDTSNYTTSLAVSDGLTRCLLDERRPLVVPKGGLGLRQSDAFYQHISNLREMIGSLQPYYGSIDRVVVSTQPRNLPDSYMPVFNAGVFFAQTLGLNPGIEVIPLSHQEGHLLAGYHQELFAHKTFRVLHISGGTTEWLHAERTGDRFELRILRHTLDISFGQLIDRIGVHMGCAFPAGKALDDMAGAYRRTGIKRSFSAEGFNLSGLENKLKRDYDAQQDAGRIATTLFSYLCEMIGEMKRLDDEPFPLLIVGGVGENRMIRSYFTDQPVYFTPKGLSSDNAVGLSRYPAFLEALCD